MIRFLLFTGCLAVSSGLIWNYNQTEDPYAPDAMEEYITLCATPAFQNLHENPMPYHHHSEQGQDITFPVEGGAAAKAYAFQAAEETNKYVFVIHEWWGLNGHIKREAERLFEDLDRKVNVLALDLYDGQVGTTREEASKLVRSADRDRLFAIIEGARAYAGDDAQIGTIGWCFGGGWSLQASIALGEQAAGCVIYYGRPEKDVDRLKSLSPDVLGIFGTQDRGIPPNMVAEFEENMEAAGKTLMVHNYEAGHGFANPSNPNHVEEYADAAWALAVNFLSQRL
ncbi:MAG: dienelactone hydrolase family protein [Bacteroidota bacterium]